MRYTEMRHAKVLRRYLVALTVFSSLLWPSNVLAETVDAMSAVKTAIKNLDTTNLDEDWYFTMEVLEEGEVKIIRSDPTRDPYERRQLLTLDGETPNNQYQSAFYDKEVKRIDDIDPKASGYAHMVDIQTLQQVDNQDGYATFTFLPRVKVLEGSRDGLSGTLLLNLSTQQVEEIEIYNIEKLSPAFSVTLDTFRLQLYFGSQVGENLLQKLESHTVGKMGFFKSFDAIVVVEFSDYARAQP